MHAMSLQCLVLCIPAAISRCRGALIMSLGLAGMKGMMGGSRGLVIHVGRMLIESARDTLQWVLLLQSITLCQGC